VNFALARSSVLHFSPTLTQARRRCAKKNLSQEMGGSPTVLQRSTTKRRLAWEYRAFPPSFNAIPEARGKKRLKKKKKRFQQKKKGFSARPYTRAVRGESKKKKSHGNTLQSLPLKAEVSSGRGEGNRKGRGGETLPARRGKSTSGVSERHDHGLAERDSFPRGIEKRGSGRTSEGAVPH